MEWISVKDNSKIWMKFETTIQPEILNKLIFKE